MPSVIISDDALKDLAEIKSYLFPLSPQAANRILTELFGAFETLSKYPRMGHPRPDLTSRPLLFWTEKRKMIVYRVTADRLEIVRVIDSYRDIKNIL